MDPISSVGLVASVIQLLSAVGELIKYTNDARNASGDQARLAGEIASFAAFLTKFNYEVQKYDLGQPEFAGLAEAAGENGLLTQLLAAITRVLGKVKRWTWRKRFIKSLTWPLEKREVDEVLTLIQRLTNYITMVLASDNIRLAIRIDSGVAELKDHAAVQKTANEFQTILHWISTLEFSKKQSDHLARCYPGTGMWLLEDETFKKWSSGTAKTMWCHGQPGSGKTTLMSLIINHFQSQHTEQHIGVAYLYFNYKEEHTQTAENMVASVLEQLVHQNNDNISPELRAKYKQHHRAGTRLRLSETSELLQSETKRFSNTYVFIDALDECSRQDGNLDKFMAEIRSLRPYAHILVTSRTSPSTDIDSDRVDYSLEIRATPDDIRHYLQGRLQSEERLGRVLRKDEDLKLAIIGQITNNADGMFLLAQLQIDFLSHKNNRRDIRRSLDRLPRQLNDVYDAALRRIANQSQEDFTLAERLLLWIICAKRPLRRVEVQHALAVEPDDSDLVEEGIPDEDILIDACAGLVTVDSDSAVVRLVHYTAQEYFEQTFRPRLGPFRVEMASICITYLSFSSLVPQADVDTQLVTHPLLPYAAQHWGAHVQDAGPDALTSSHASKQILQDKILAFCDSQDRVQVWYRVLHRVESGYDLDDVNSFSKITALHVACGQGLVDIVRHILAHYHITSDMVNARDMNGDTPVHCAASRGHAAVISVLLEQCRDVLLLDQPNIMGRTPLWLAAEKGHAEVVERLVGASASGAEWPDRDVGSTGLVDVNRVDEVSGTGETALWRAADRGYHAVVRALVACPSVDVNVRDTVYGETPLLRAVGQGHVGVVREILEGRCDVDVRTGDRFYNETPLERAKEKGFDEIAILLETYHGNGNDGE